MVDLSRYTGLLIDDIAEMRSAVRIQLTDCGLVKCDMARNVKEAVDRISHNHYDIIVCDYNLGQGADGQQLLELARRRKLLPLSTAFLIITGETGYEQVSTAAEYAPDDYLIKPFTSQTLQTRLERILDKKQALKPLYQHLGGAKADHVKALAACDALQIEQPRYLFDVLRIKGELLLEAGKLDEALALYQGVLAQRSTPWAEVGKARVLAADGNGEEAKAHLERALEAYPNYLAAYDSMAQLLEKEDKAAAQEIVERALKVAPSTQRQRRLGALALDNQDFVRAEEAFNRAVEKDRTGFFKSHDDYAGLAKSRVAQGKVQEALSAVKEMGQSFRGSPELTVRQAAVESIVHARSGNAAAAKAALEKALAASKDVALDPEASLEIANACFASGDDVTAKRIIQSVAEDHQENPQVLAQAQGVFRAAGLGDEGELFLEATKKRMIALNNDAVAMAKAGELEQACAMLEEAADRLLNNAQVSINAAIAALMRFQRDKTEGAIEKAHRYITQAQRANPEHPRLAEAITLYRRLAPDDAPTLLVP